MIGGAVTFVNPEPLALFADVIAAGEGESLIPDLADVLRQTRDRQEVLAALATRRGFYIPEFYDVRYADTGAIAAFEPKPGTSAPGTVKKAAIKSTERLDPPATSIFPPDTEFGSRFLVEVVRGCANLCRFCWAGYNYLPVRAFSADRPVTLDDLMEDYVLHLEHHLAQVRDRVRGASAFGWLSSMVNSPPRLCSMMQVPGATRPLPKLQ